LDVSENHINSIVYKVRGTGGTDYRDMDLTTLELLEKPLYYEKKGYGKYEGNKYGSARMFIRNVAPVQYPHKSLPVDPYTLGLLIGDGTVRKNSKSVRLTAHVDDWHEYKEYIPYELGKAHIQGNTATHVIKGVGTYMRDLGLNVNAQHKFIPESYFTASVEQRLGLLQGLIDSDGYIRKGKRGFSFFTVSEKLSEDVCRLVRSLGGTAKIVKPNYREDRNFPLQKLSCKLNMPVVRLQRKRNSLVHVPNADMVEVTSITKIESVPTQCIAIDNKDKQFIAGNYVRTHNSGIRGQRYRGERIDVIIGDDLVKTEADSRSETIMKNIRSTIYSDATHALRAQGGMEILIGTPFNKKDVVYSAVEGGWTPLVVPICERIRPNLKKEEFKGAWPEMHSYERVMSRYTDMQDSEEGRAFQQELMLRISSEEDKLIKEDQIQWYSRKLLEPNIGAYNVVITTDLTASNNLKGDFSVILCWAVNSKNDWFLLDAVVKKMTIEDQFKPIFAMNTKWGAKYGKNIQVGIEIDGQQQLNLYTLKKLQLEYNSFFTFARQIGSPYGKEGISRRQAQGAKHEQFMRVHPLFQQHKIYFPEELKNTPDMEEVLHQLNYVTYEGFGAKHDDALDGISMIASLDIVLPSEDVGSVSTSIVGDGLIWEGDWGDDKEENFTGSTIF
jgi:phage terminase large subunit-like protein